jgi:hypothetical protein
MTMMWRMLIAGATGCALSVLVGLAWSLTPVESSGLAGVLTCGGLAVGGLLDVRAAGRPSR